MSADTSQLLWITWKPKPLWHYMTLNIHWSLRAFIPLPDWLQPHKHIQTLTKEQLITSFYLIALIKTLIFCSCLWQMWMSRFSYVVSGWCRACLGWKVQYKVTKSPSYELTWIKWPDTRCIGSALKAQINLFFVVNLKLDLNLDSI